MGYQLKAENKLVRLAEKKDYNGILKLSKMFLSESKYPYKFDEGSLLNNFINCVDNPDHFILVMERSGEVVGFLWTTVTRSLFSSDLMATELAWYVDPDYRGSTHTIKMVKFYEVWARSRGAKTTSMACITTLNDLGSVYERMGYTLTEKAYIKEN